MTSGGSTNAWFIGEVGCVPASRDALGGWRVHQLFVRWWCDENSGVRLLCRDW